MQQVDNDEEEESKHIEQVMHSFNLMKLTKPKTSIIENFSTMEDNSAQAGSTAQEESDYENTVFFNSPITYSQGTRASKIECLSSSTGNSAANSGKSTNNAAVVVPKQEQSFASVMQQKGH